jgi:hypothetical protein
MVNAIMLGIQTVIGMTYTNIGVLLGFVGSFCGLFLMYIVPIGVYLKQTYLEILFPTLAFALEENRVKTAHGMKT